LIEALTRPLTEAEKKSGQRKQTQPARIPFKGTLEEVQYFFTRSQWTDGLPVIPPTEEAVGKMLKGTSHSGEEILGLLRPEFWQVNVEKIAINAVMAGCKPQDLPVVLAAVAGYIEKEHESMLVSATSMVAMHLVNGPIRNEIGMNKGLGAQGPGNQANASIGRAITLCLINLGGWWPGRSSMGTQGHPAQYTFCIPENEETSPWEPFHAGKGYRAEESTLSVFIDFGGLGGGCEGGLRAIPRALRSIQNPRGATVLLDPSLAKIISDEGYTKKELQQWLWENTTMSFKEWWQGPFLPNFMEKHIGEPGYWPESYKRGNLPPDTIVHCFPSAETINIIVVGGASKILFQSGGNKYRFSSSIDRWR
jgi:hypothetical protein